MADFAVHFDFFINFRTPSDFHLKIKDYFIHMFNFDLKKTAIYQAVKWEKFPVFRFASFLKRLFLILFLVSLAIFLYGFLSQKFSFEASRNLLGFSLVLLVLAVGSTIKGSFFRSKIKNPKLEIPLSEAASFPEKYNLAEFLSFETAKAASKSLKFSGGKEADASHLLYFILSDNPKLNFIFSRILLDLREVKENLKELISSQVVREIGASAYSQDFQGAILEALEIARKRNHSRIEIGDILTALAKWEKSFKQILIESGIKSEDIENLSFWLENLEEKSAKRKRFWEYQNLLRQGSLAREWTAGYTINLNKYSQDITEFFRKKAPEIVGHEKEITAAERFLAGGKINNVLLVGEPGTGRKSIIYGLARRALYGESLPEVNYKRVVELNLVSLLTEIENPEEVEALLSRIFQEALLAGNVILVIDEFHNYVGQASRPGVVDISGVIAPYLRFSQFQVVAVTSYDGLHRYIEKNPSILSLFGKIEVSEISLRETLRLLESLALGLERKYKKFVSYPALREIISLSERYLPSLPFPEKAMDLLEEAVIYTARSTREKIVLPKHISKIITQKTDIPVGEMETKEKEILLNLENLIHQRIINQNEAVREVSTALRRARAQVTVRKGPMGGFLFLGPTGVGKTETSKALAEIYFGSEKRMIRLDMSEFQDIKDIPRLIGSPEEPGLLITPVRENPFSLILLDEIEKANPNVLNLFLQVLDEGHLTDGFGRKIDFRNTIIIATSNAGYEVILQALKEKAEWGGVKQKLLEQLFEQRIFRPEFINRFDAVVVFRALTKENLLDIAGLLFGKLKKNLAEKGVELIINLPLKEKIVELGYSPVFGAREMRRVIQDKVENVLASALLSGNLKRGDRVEVDSDNFELIINAG